jgi:transposase-like protein
MMYVRYPLSLRQVEDLLHERGVDISHKTVRVWWNRFGSHDYQKLLRLHGFKCR